MDVKILKAESETRIEAVIQAAGKAALPSLQEGWRFNFEKHSKTKGAQTYILIVKQVPDAIEGCLIFKMKDKLEPYMAFIEIAPHNKGKAKKYDLVAGCLIAYACWLSFVLGESDYKGWLAFDIQEANDTDQEKLMSMYSKKYNAKRFGTTTMLITPLDGEKLINEYLEP